MPEGEKDKKNQGGVLLGSQEAIDALPEYVRENIGKWIPAKKGILYITGQEVADVDPYDPKTEEDNGRYVLESANALLEALRPYPYAYKIFKSGELGGLSRIYEAIKKAPFNINSVSANQKIDFAILSTDKFLDQTDVISDDFRVTNLKADWVANMPQTKTDFIVYSIAHEAGHANAIIDGVPNI